MGLAESDRRLPAMLHIPKAAGQTLVYLLRRHFGIRHVDVGHHVGRPYTPAELRHDLRAYPWARSLAGHWLRPFVDFEEFADRLDWYTVVREPVARFISHFEFQVRYMGRREDFEAWIDREPVVRNTQVRHIAGTEDVAAAKQILSERFRCVGLMEEFDATLIILRKRLGLAGWRVAYDRARNVGRGDVRERLMERFDELRKTILEYNQLDQELYRFVRDELWPAQVADYGEEQLRADLASAFADRQPRLREKWRYWTGVLYRNLVYKPFLRLDGGRVTRQRTPAPNR